MYGPRSTFSSKHAINERIFCEASGSEKFNDRQNPGEGRRVRFDNDEVLSISDRSNTNKTNIRKTIISKL